MNAEIEADRRDHGGLRGRRVLIVEDIYLLATELAQALARDGAEIVGPCPGVEAARSVLETAAPDLAILDVNLREETSTQLAETLQGRGVPVIIVTGLARETLPDSLAGDTILSKPADLGELTRLARTLLLR